eukprot:3077023-Rhodomonas_salina.2
MACCLSTAHHTPCAISVPRMGATYAISVLQVPRHTLVMLAALGSDPPSPGSSIASLSTGDRIGDQHSMAFLSTAQRISDGHTIA